MMPTGRSYLLRETAISMGINAVLSAVFVFLIFRGKTKIGLWGAGGLAFDFVPQTFMVALMAALVPTLLTRKAARKGSVPAGPAFAARLPGNAFVRALLVAVTVTAVGVPLAILVVDVSSPGGLLFSAVLVAKVIYGTSLACIVTPVAIRAALADGVGIA